MSAVKHQVRAVGLDFQFPWSLPLSVPLRIGFRIDSVHHPADIRQTSSAPGIFSGALTAAEFLCGHDLFHYERTAVIQQILLDVFAGILETITYKIDHLFIPQSRLFDPFNRSEFFISLFCKHYCANNQLSAPTILTPTLVNHTRKF